MICVFRAKQYSIWNINTITVINRELIFTAGSEIRSTDNSIINDNNNKNDSECLRQSTLYQIERNPGHSAINKVRSSVCCFLLGKCYNYGAKLKTLSYDRHNLSMHTNKVSIGTCCPLLPLCSNVSNDDIKLPSKLNRSILVLCTVQCLPAVRKDYGTKKFPYPDLAWGSRFKRGLFSEYCSFPLIEILAD